MKYLLICAPDRVVDFPWCHILLHPCGGGFTHIDNCHPNLHTIKSPVLIDPVGLNPATLPRKVVGLLRRYRFSKPDIYSYEANPFRIIFLDYPSTQSDVIDAVCERVSNCRIKSRIEYYFPEQGIRGFHDMFHHLPFLSYEETKREYDETLSSFSKLCSNEQWAEASQETHYLQVLLSLLCDFRKVV